MNTRIRFTPEDWQRIRRDWTAFWDGELARPLVLIHHSHETDALNKLAPKFVTTLPNEMPADEVVARYQQRLEAAEFFGDAFPKWFLNFGPGIIAGFVGADVHTVPETVWFTPAARQSIDQVHPAYDPHNFWWQRIRSLTQAAVDRWGSEAAVSFTDLGGNLDIVASLRDTQQLLVDLMDDPAEVGRLVNEVTRLWLRYYTELNDIIAPAGAGTTPWAAIWSARKCYMLQSDFAYMISPKMFERYVLPDLTDCCALLDHGFYHLDGKGQIPHVDHLLSIERLRGIQWIPGDGAPPPEKWLPLLKRIRDGGKFVQVYVTAEGARTIVRELGGRGFILSINDDLPAGQARALFSELTGS